MQFWFTHLVLCEFNSCTVLRLVTQLCRTIFDPMDCSPPISSVHGDSPGKNTGVGCHALFPAQGSNPGLPHCGWILYHLKHQGSPRILEWVVHPFSRGIFPIQELNQCLLHSRWILYQLSYQGSSCESLYNLDLMWKWTQQGTSYVGSYCFLAMFLFHPSPSPFQGWSSISSWHRSLSVDHAPFVLSCSVARLVSGAPSVPRPVSIQGGSSS